MTVIVQTFGKYIWFKDQYMQHDEGLTSIMSHALHYGSSAFEGIRIYDQQPFKLQQHLQRLQHSAEQLAITLPYTQQHIHDACMQLIALNKVKNGYMRPLVWRGAGDNLWVCGKTCPIQMMVAAWNCFAAKRPDQLQHGKSLHISKWTKPSPSSSPYNSKISSIYTMATIIKNEAELLGFDDALILDDCGYITEATSANVFFIAGDKLLTPIADCFLNGITRQTIIHEVAPSLGLSVEERHIEPSELSNFDGAFLTGTAIEVVPIASITTKSHGQQLFSLPNQIIADIIDAYGMLTSSLASTSSLQT